MLIYLLLDSFFAEFDLPVRFVLPRLLEFEYFALFVFNYFYLYSYNGPKPTDLGARTPNVPISALVDMIA